MQLTIAELRRRFQHHPPPNEEVVEKHQRVRAACLAAAEEIRLVTGEPTPEQTLAIRKLEEAMFWANAAIARPTPPR